MNGIAGIAYPHVFQFSHLITPMLDTLKHRGGTIKDTHTYRNLQIGITGTKLAFNEKKTIAGGFDGEIFNFEEVGKEIKKNGYPTFPQNTAEVIIYAYDLWGPSFIDKIDGDFAVMILDQNRERIILARDRLGKKPLYWFHDQHYFIFASELKAILATGAVPQTPAKDAIASYLYFGYTPQDMTIVKGVNKLLPGHYLQFNRDKSIFIQPYWSYSSHFTHKVSLHKNTIVKKVDNMIINSVEERIPQDGPIGCFVSGGLGSAAVAYYVSTLAKKNVVSAYTVGFKGENDKDVETAQIVAKELGISHLWDFITPETFLDNIVNISWYLDEPLADPNVTATWRLCDLASKEQNIVFSGMGSDELFAGHNRYMLEGKQQNLLSRLLQFPKPVIQRILIPLLNFIYKPFVYDLLKQARTNPWQFEYLRQNAIFSEKELAEAAPHLAGLFDPEVFLHKFHNLFRIKSSVASFLYFDVKTRLADSFVLQYERLTASHQLDWRTPLLDQQLFEFIATLPEPASLLESETGSYLKGILKTVFPEAIVNRPKVTRRDFLKKWVVQSDLYELFKKLLNGTLVETGFISREWLLDKMETPDKFSANFPQLWSVLALEIWFRLYINRQITDSPPDISLRELLMETL